MWPLDRIAAEWPVLKPMIAAAPVSVSILILACLAIGFGVAAYLGSREKKAVRAERDAAKGEKSLLEALNKQLKEESANLAAELTELKKLPEPPAFNQIAHSGKQVVEALFEIEEKKTTNFRGPLSALTEDQLNKFASFARLRDAGAVNIQIYGLIPQNTVVTSTSTASELTGFVKAYSYPKPK